MPRRRLIWHIFSSYVLVTLVGLAAITAYTTRSLGNFHMAHVGRDLEARARLMADTVRVAVSANDAPQMQALVTQLGEKSSSRVTVILPSGKVVADSQESPERMDNHANRPEIIQAMAGDVGHAVRFSQTLQRDLMYVAVPINESERLIAVLRTALPLTRIQAALWSDRADIVLGAAVIALLAVAMSWFVARQISRPLELLKQGAELFAQGDFKHKLRTIGSDEIAGLARAMNQMAEQLDERIRTIINQGNQQKAVLSSMIEGVIAVDANQCVISMNQSAGRMLGINVSEAQGKSIESVVRNAALQQFIARALDSHAPIENECVLYAPEEQVVQLHGTVLRDTRGNALGAVIVLNDVTRLRRLEQVRQDFVANVSHELRTPITSIKGFVETLLDGALDKPKDARRFLEIVAKQADRLMAILEDLLALSRIEAGTSRKEVRLEPSNLLEIIEAAVALCRPKAAAKGIQITVDCPDTLQVRVNPPLLEQAIANLVDNAVKYSGSNESVCVAAEQVGEEVILRVQDRGVGIPHEHLPRLFERFYRVDKARSRSLGGTGLGLSIVKHIASAHGGQVRVESTPGHGSTFSIHLPR
jgi:two-component system phosphate regulon sensor histidine kinase PhoR